MFKRVVTLLIMFIVISTHYTSVKAETNLDVLFENEQHRILVSYSLEKAENLAEIIYTGSYFNPNNFSLDEQMIQKLEATDFSQPLYALVMYPNSNNDVYSVLQNQEIPRSMMSSVCFDITYSTNTYCGDYHFAEWAERTSLYGILKEDVPDIAYVVLVYSKDAPQIALSVCKEKDDELAITKTSFIYNEMYTSKIYAALPSFADIFWGNMEMCTYAFVND